MITPIKWDLVRTDPQWVSALATILGDIEDSAQADSSERQQLQSQLQTFVQRSPERVSALDKIAVQASVDIMIVDLTRRVAEIKARNAQLEVAALALGVEVDAANRDAGRLVRITAEINKAKDAITTVKDMVARLGDDNADAIDTIRAILDGFSRLNEIYRPND